MIGALAGEHLCRAHVKKRLARDRNRVVDGGLHQRVDELERIPIHEQLSPDQGVGRRRRLGRIQLRQWPGPPHLRARTEDRDRPGELTRIPAQPRQVREHRASHAPRPKRGDPRRVRLGRLDCQLLQVADQLGQ